MDNNHHITHDNFVQSQIFKNILLSGTKMASFLHGAEFNNSQQKELAEQLVKSWSDACEGFADNCNEVTLWEAIRYDEIMEDITEYLAKAKALVDMALISDFNNIAANTLHDYFWELSSLIDTTEMVFKDMQ